MKSKQPRQFDRNKAIYAGVITILIIIFVVIFTYGLNKVLAMEGQFPPVINTEGRTPPPADVPAALTMLDSSYESAQKLKPKVSRSDSLDIDTGSIETDGSDEFNKTLEFTADSLEEKLEELFPEAETDFGSGFTEDIHAPRVTAADITDHTYYVCDKCGKRSESEPEECEECSAEKSYSEQSERIRCNYIYYKCRSCGETSDVPRAECEKCGSVYPYEMHYNDDYEITLYIKPESVGSIFETLPQEEIDKTVSDGANGRFRVEKLKSEVTDAKVIYRTERVSDKLKYLEYFRVIHVTAGVAFTGDYSVLGNKTVSFDVRERNRFEFTWPALELNLHEMSIEPRATDNLLATLTCTDPAKQTVTWTSSDEELFTVDEDGYIKANKTEGSGTVTASFEFDGETYSDTCVVNVRYSVEALKVSPGKVKLTPGGTAELKAAVSPSKATVKTVTWHSEDESVASVDENGVITAVSKGSTVVFAVSDDGYYKSSCEVIVN